MKILMLGMDALDGLLIDQFSDDLPNFNRLISEGIRRPVQSTFPPDSDTAWATAYTGLNPAEHGIVRFVDPLEKSYRIQNEAVDNRILHGNTFFDILNQTNIRAHAIFPHLGFPVWETGGTLVARATNKSQIGAVPPGILDLYPDPENLPGVRGFPSRSPRGMRQFVQAHKAQAYSDAEFALQVMHEVEWDLMFVYWSTLDAICHFFWSYHDPTDPLFEPGNEFEGVIRDAYRWLDEILGMFMDEVSDEVTVIVLSDHGHGGRPNRLVNVNEILRRMGLLRARDPSSSTKVSLLESIRSNTIRAVDKYGLAKLAGWGLRLVPAAMKLYTRPQIIDWEDSVAYASDMSGIKAYTYGGIRINQETLGKLDYEEVRDRIIQGIPAACGQLDEGEEIVEFICRREDLYSGPKVEEFPDILIGLRYGYGLGWEVFSPLIAEASTHNIVPGSHRGDTGVLISRDPEFVSGPYLDLMDVKELLVGRFGLDGF